MTSLSKTLKHTPLGMGSRLPRCSAPAPTVAYTLLEKPYLSACEMLESPRLGFHVPQLIRADDDLWVIEMTIVTRPFVLDFAGAYLNSRPEFSEETWWSGKPKSEKQFVERWRTVLRVMSVF